MYLAVKFPIVRYSDTRALNKIVRKQEKSLALELAKPRWSRRKLEYHLEWFVTWKIKQITLSDPMWCDGAEITHLERESRKLFSIEATLRVGPESDIRVISEAKMKGHLCLTSHAKQLKSYNLVISESGSKYVLSKTT